MKMYKEMKKYLLMLLNMSMRLSKLLEMVRDAKSDALENVPKASRRYCLVGDFCQNMNAPHFGSEQPGATYYFSPLNVYCFGMVDVAAGPELKLYSHIYHEGEGKKGGDDVASMIVKTLKMMDLIPKQKSEELFHFMK
jgi:hypothetical protein